MENIERKIKRLSDSELIDAIIHFNGMNSQQVKGKNNRQRWGLIEEEFFNRGIGMDFYGTLLNSLLENSIRNPDVLHFYIKAFLRWDIPRVKYCLDHVAPFTFISDVFFDKIKNPIAFANRTGGKTLASAIIIHVCMAFKPGIEVMNAGAIREQASGCYDYFESFHISNKVKQSKLLVNLVRNGQSGILRKGETKYKNGSKTKIVTASYDAFNGPHPHIMIIDEVELIEVGVLNQGLSCAMTKGSLATEDVIESHTLFLSTRKEESGPMQWILDKAKADLESKRPTYKVYEWCVWEIIQKCTRKCKDDPKYGDCKLYDYPCGRKVKEKDGG